MADTEQQPQQPEQEAAGAEPAADVTLPKAAVKRIVKQKLTQLSEGASGRASNTASDAMLALEESARVFVSFLASTANDIAKEHKRQTISQDDVFRALEDLEFGELVDPLRDVVKAAKEAAAKKKAEAASAKKRKAADKEHGADDGGAKPDAGQGTPAAGEGAAPEEAPDAAQQQVGSPAAMQDGEQGGDDAAQPMDQDGGQ